jgi:hypothetical protein
VPNPFIDAAGFKFADVDENNNLTGSGRLTTQIGIKIIF